MFQKNVKDYSDKRTSKEPITAKIIGSYSSVKSCCSRNFAYSSSLSIINILQILLKYQYLYWITDHKYGVISEFE